jgi:lipid-A-disaccharide synthase
MSKKVMIVTGEASGDLHGANLVRAMLAQNPELQFCGMGGKQLQSLGVDILFDAEKVSVVGISEVFAHAADIIRAQRVLRKRLAEQPPDLLIIIDLPDFNLMLAKQAKKRGIPVFYYICPQVWAWRTGRVKTITARTDSLGVILPFEKDFFNNHGARASYVGHPLLDSVQTSLTRDEFRSQLALDKKTRCIGLLPGSRLREVSSLLPDFMAAAEKLDRQTNQRLVFVIPRASTISLDDLNHSGVKEFSDRLDLRVIEDDRYSLMAACDCVVAASGTVTLELAILGVPMVVTYRVAPASYRLGRLLVTLEHFSLVNLIAGYQVVPELLQDQVTPERICKELALLLNVYSVKERMRHGLRVVRKKLGSSGASRRAAELAFELLKDGS